MRFHSLAILSALLFIPAARADDSADKKESNERLAQAARGLNEACGTQISVSYAWGSESGSSERPASQGPIYCVSIVEGLKSACSDEAAKSAIAAQIKTLACRFETGASKNKELDSYGGPVLQLSGTALAAFFDWNSSNLDSETAKWAAKKMLTPGQNGPVTVEAKKEQKEGEGHLAEAVAKLEEKCGTRIPVSYDFGSERGNAAKPAWQGFLYCKGVVEALQYSCESAKASIAKKVKSVACRFEVGASKKKELGPSGGAVLVLKSGVLNVSYDWATSNIEDEARKWVAKQK